MKIDRRAYAEMFGPTVGDRLRLADTALVVEIELNVGRATVTLAVANRGDRPIQVGSHYHFAETNAALEFDRAAARGHRLDIPAGTAVRFEPGQERTVELVALAGERKVYGFNAKVMGALDKKGNK